MDTVTKICCACKRAMPLSDFYKRPYTNSVTSECKDCMKTRSRGKSHHNINYETSMYESERIAIEYLHKQGIPALPGKTIRKSFVDVIAYGCIGIEVKWARLTPARGVDKFTFDTTPSQQKNGFRAQIVMLICEWGNGERSFHLFNAKDPVFYMGNRLKTGLTYTPGAYEALKHGENRVVMVQGMMDAARDNIELIEQCLTVYRSNLKG